MWNKKHLLDIESLSRDDIEFIIKCAEILEPYSGRGNKLDICRGEILANVFFEPSTRTEKSFQAAMYVLGGDVITHKNVGSSIEKGESKEDTIRTLEQYSDVLVIRDPEIGSVKKYSNLVNIQVINAGDGASGHPTQSLMDLYTIKKEIGKLNDLTIVFMGDLKNARTVHSLKKAIEKFDNTKIYGIAPKGLESEDIELIDAKELTNVKPDILYITRIQKERIPEQERNNFSFRFDSKILNMLPNNAKVMHPLPRVDEMDPSLDKDPRIIPFKQARYGLQTRMAILALILGHEKEILAL